MSIDVNQHDHEVVMGSERSFGFVFAGLFTVIALYPAAFGGGLRWWSIAVAAAFLAVSLIKPQTLKPLNVLWFRFGLLLGRVMTPIIMMLIYFVTVVPIGLVMRAAGKDLLRLAREPDRRSYWIEREPGSSGKGSMKRQF